MLLLIHVVARICPYDSGADHSRLRLYDVSQSRFLRLVDNLVHHAELIALLEHTSEQVCLIS